MRCRATRCCSPCWHTSSGPPAPASWPPCSRRTLFQVAVVATLTVALVIGQIPFLLGVALGVSAVVALLNVPGRRGWVLAASLALACSLASPLPGALLLLVAAGLSANVPWRRLTALGAAVGGLVVAVAVGGAGGPMPFPWTSLTCTLAFCGHDDAGNSDR